jgi:hypothetical protein
MPAFDQYTAFIGLEDYRQLEEAFLPATDPEKADADACRGA